MSGTFIRGLEPGDKLALVNSHNYMVQTFGVGPDGALLSVNENCVLNVSHSESHQTVRTLPTLAAGESSTTFLSNFRISPEGSKVAVANHNGRGVNILELKSGRRLYSLPDDSGSIWWLAWHPDGRHLLVSRGNGDISLWNLAEVEATLAGVGLAP